MEWEIVVSIWIVVVSGWAFLQSLISFRNTKTFIRIESKLDELLMAKRKDGEDA